MKTVQLFALLGVLLSSPAFAGSSKAAEPTKMPTVFQNPLLLYYAQKQAANYVKSDFDGVDPSDTGTLLKIIIKQAAADAGNRAWQAATDIKAKIDKVSLTGANEWIWQAATDVQDAYDHMDSTDLGKWLKQASQDVGLNATLKDLRAVKYEDLPADALEYIKNNPAQTVFYIVNGVALFSPATVWGPLLGVLGFSPAGVGAETLAATLQSMFGGAVPAGSWFAHLQSAAMGGYGVAALNGVMRFGAGIAVAAKGVVDHLTNTNREVGPVPEKRYILVSEHIAHQ